MQPIIKFEAFLQMVSINTNSNLPGAYIFRSALGFYYNLLLIYRSATGASVGVCSLDNLGVEYLYGMVHFL